LDNKTEIDANFERVARNYLKTIKSHQPDGPYFIGGYCLGGTLALEIAQQLMNQGEEIGLLFMIENYNIKEIKWPLPFYLNMANRFLNVWYHAGNLLASNNDAKRVFFSTKVQTEFSRFKVSLQILLSSLLKTMGAKKALDFPHTRVDRVYDEALIHYEPKPFNGKIVLFGAQKRLAGFADPLYGWGGIAKHGIEMHELPINPHGSLVAPFVRVLAEKLRKCVNEKL
jgi:thioesterase domain-containing protein